MVSGAGDLDQARVRDLGGELGGPGGGEERALAAAQDQGGCAHAARVRGLAVGDDEPARVEAEAEATAGFLADRVLGDRHAQRLVHVGRRGQELEAPHGLLAARVGRAQREREARGPLARGRGAAARVEQHEGAGPRPRRRVTEGHVRAEGVADEGRVRVAEPLEERLEVVAEGARQELVGEVRGAVSAEVEGDDVEVAREARREVVEPVSVRARPVEEHEGRARRVPEVEGRELDAAQAGAREAFETRRHGGRRLCDAVGSRHERDAGPPVPTCGPRRRSAPTVAVPARRISRRTGLKRPFSL